MGDQQGTGKTARRPFIAQITHGKTRNRDALFRNLSIAPSSGLFWRLSPL
jgi:hypothetical protein